MKNKMKSIALGFALMLSIFTIGVAAEQLFHPTTAEAVFVNKNVDSKAANTNAESGKIITQIFSFANIFAGIVLAISIVMIILGGLRYILAAGDQRAAEQGKLILIYSALGILISLSAFALGRFFQGFAVGGT